MGQFGLPTWGPEGRASPWDRMRGGPPSLPPGVCAAVAEGRPGPRPCPGLSAALASGHPLRPGPCGYPSFPSVGATEARCWAQPRAVQCALNTFLQKLGSKEARLCSPWSSKAGPGMACASSSAHLPPLAAPLHGQLPLAHRHLLWRLHPASGDIGSPRTPALLCCGHKSRYFSVSSGAGREGWFPPRLQGPTRGVLGGVQGPRWRAQLRAHTDRC